MEAPARRVRVGARVEDAPVVTVAADVEGAGAVDRAGMDGEWRPFWSWSSPDGELREQVGELVRR